MRTLLSPLFRCVRAALPQGCVLCGCDGAIDGLCRPCWTALPAYPDARCPVCATPISTKEVCGACLRRSPAYDQVIPAWVYSLPLSRLVQSLKYSGRLAAATPMARALSAAIVGAEVPDLIVAMPLSRERLAQRGFNQAQEIARLLAQATGIMLATGLLLRQRHTHPQSMLPWKERARNVRGAFRCNETVTGTRIALIDDVLTTGSTLHEAARALKSQGASEVTGWIVARAVPRDASLA